MPPVNGYIACNVTENEQRCYPECPAGFQFSSPLPLSGFYSCLAGNWYPTETIPECAELAFFVSYSNMFWFQSIPSSELFVSNSRLGMYMLSCFNKLY